MLKKALFSISRIPTSLHYLFSDYFLFPILYYVLSYRSKVVKANIDAAFPDKCESEKQHLKKSFYRYLSDLFVETVRSFQIPETELKERVIYQNMEILEKLYREDKSIILTLGHIGNYEWMAQAMPLFLPHQIAVAYRKLKNPTMEQAFKEARTRYGADFFPTEETGLFLRKSHDRPFMLVLANDQSAHPHKCYWTKFLNQDTSFHVGTEKVAKKVDLPVVFAHVSVPKRGHYVMRFEVLEIDPIISKDGEIMKKHSLWLEQDIKESAANWLWSHKRWKHKMPAEYGYGFTER